MPPEVREDLDDAWWIIPAGVVKNKMQHHVPLSRQTRQVIDSLRPLNGRSEWVFASRKKPDRPITWPVWTCRRLCDRIGFRFVPHDLRRTATTHMARMGVQRIVLAKTLNHADNGVTEIYDRSTYDREKQEAVTRSRSLLSQPFTPTLMSSGSGKRRCFVSGQMVVRLSFVI